MGKPLAVIDSRPSLTSAGTPYLIAPGVALLAEPQLDVAAMRPFLEGFSNLDATDYIEDITVDDAVGICKIAGQLCYMSFGPKRTRNADAGLYLDHIKESHHGSVLEHANFTLLFWGISRSVTHEMVRHRAGFSYSQVSQRYVGASAVRFVERPEYQADAYLHARFIERIDRVRQAYAEMTESLAERQADGYAQLAAEQKTDLRKRVQQVARSLLPNEVEAPIVVTANVRAWRHFFEMRASAGAETEIRRAAFAAFTILRGRARLLFDDYMLAQQADGSATVSTRWGKV